MYIYNRRVLRTRSRPGCFMLSWVLNQPAVASIGGSDAFGWATSAMKQNQAPSQARCIWWLWKHNHFDGFTSIHRRISGRNPIQIDRHVENGMFMASSVPTHSRTASAPPWVCSSTSWESLLLIELAECDVCASACVLSPIFEFKVATIFLHDQAWYCSSLTFSIQSAVLPSRRS